MKSNTKTYKVLILLFVAFILPSEAQTRTRTITKTTVTRTNSKTPGKVSSKKVVYKTPTKKVVSVRSIPNRTIVKHNGQDYYYANNKYYTSSRGRYISIAPKVGFRINTLPTNFVRVQFNNHRYFNVGGTFYIESNSGYEVVDPEIGTIVYELPEGYEKITIDGLTYFEYSNIIYEKIQIEGSRAYEVVGLIDME